MKTPLTTYRQALRHLQRGESFFVPTLDPHEEDKRVHRAARMLGVRGIKTSYGIYRQMYGIMVKRR